MKLALSIAAICLAIVCAYAQETTLSPEQVKRNEINAVIAKLSSRCKTTVQAQTAGDETIEAGCKKLESFKLLLGIVGCETTDYNNLHAVLCYLNGVYVG